MGLYESSGQLAKAMKLLQHRWLETSTDWDDAVRRSFQQRHLEPLEADVRQAISVMEQARTLVQQARNRCS